MRIENQRRVLFESNYEKVSKFKLFETFPLILRISLLVMCKSLNFFPLNVQTETIKHILLKHLNLLLKYEWLPSIFMIFIGDLIHICRFHWFWNMKAFFFFFFLIVSLKYCWKVIFFITSLKYCCKDFFEQLKECVNALTLKILGISFNNLG